MHIFGWGLGLPRPLSKSTVSISEEIRADSHAEETCDRLHFLEPLAGTLFHVYWWPPSTLPVIDPAGPVGLAGDLHGQTTSSAWDHAATSTWYSSDNVFQCEVDDHQSSTQPVGSFHARRSHCASMMSQNEFKFTVGVAFCDNNFQWKIGPPSVQGHELNSLVWFRLCYWLTSWWFNEINPSVTWHHVGWCP